MCRLPLTGVPDAGPNLNNTLLTHNSPLLFISGLSTNLAEGLASTPPPCPAPNKLSIWTSRP